MGLDAINSIWVAEEISYGRDPDNTGAAYAWLPQVEPTRVKDLSESAETNYQVDQNWPTPPEATVDGWEMPIKWRARGLPTSAGDGVAPPARIVDDYLYENIFGSHIDTSGEGVAALSTTTNLILDTAALGLQQLVPVYEANLATPDRTIWALVRDVTGAPTYVVNPAMDVAPTTNAVAYGKRTYLFNDNFEGSLAFIARRHDRTYRLLGGKIMNPVLEVKSGGPAIWTATVRGDSKEDITGSVPGSLPSPARVAQPACLGVRAAFWFNGTKYSIANAKLDLKLNAILRAGQEGANGRVAGRHIMGTPEISVDPLFATALESAWRSKTVGRLLYFVGIGVLASGRLNTICAHMENAVIGGYEETSRDGEKAVNLTFRSTTPVTFESGTTVARPFQYAMA